VWDNQPDMAFTNPERTQYRECAIWVGCSFQGTAGQVCLQIWVSNDFTLARGWFMGFAKKFGQTYLTEYHPRDEARRRGTSTMNGQIAFFGRVGRAKGTYGLHSG
jgi:hypothetical protein